MVFTHIIRYCANGVIDSMGYFQLKTFIKNKNNERYYDVFKTNLRIFEKERHQLMKAQIKKEEKHEKHKYYRK